jgi:hypothetical protein
VGAALGQFHVTVYVNNPRSAQLAITAMLDRTPIAIGSDIDEDVEIVTGFVQSIEEDADAVPRRGIWPAAPAPTGGATIAASRIRSWAIVRSRCRTDGTVVADVLGGLRSGVEP